MPFMQMWGSNGYGSEGWVGPVLTANETLYVTTSVPTGLASNRAVSFSLGSSGGTSLNFSWGANSAKSGTVNVIAGQTLNAYLDVSNYASTGNRNIAFTVTVKNAAGTTLSTFDVSGSVPSSGGIEV